MQGICNSSSSPASVSSPALHQTTSKSLRNHPLIDSKPYSPLLFPLKAFIKRHGETTARNPGAQNFHSAGAHQLVEVMSNNHHTASSDLLFPCLRLGEATLSLLHNTATGTWHTGILGNVKHCRTVSLTSPASAQGRADSPSTLMTTTKSLE